MAKRTRKPIRYEPQPERIGLINSLDGLVLEDNVAAGFTPASAPLPHTTAASRPTRLMGASVERDPTANPAGVKPAPTSLHPVFRDDAHGILPRILSGVLQTVRIGERPGQAHCGCFRLPHL
jgi:hypothetical protein